MKNVKNTFKVKIILLNIIFFTSFFSQYEAHRLILKVVICLGNLVMLKKVIYM